MLLGEKMNTKLFQFLKSDFIVTKTDKWESYYVKQRQKYLITACCLGVFIYFMYLFVLSLYGYPIKQFELRIECLNKIPYTEMIAVLLIISCISGIMMNKLDKFSSDNKEISWFTFKLNIKQAHKICKILFYINILFTAFACSLGLLYVPVQIVMIAVSLTFILYIICMIFGLLGTFTKLRLNQYYILVVESIFCLFLCSATGLFHSKWYIIMTSIIGIIFDSLFILFMYNDMQYIQKNLFIKTKLLSEEDKKNIYDIEIMNEVSMLYITIYNLILNFCKLLMGSAMDD